MGCICRLGRADNSKTVPAPIHRPDLRAMTLAMFTERNPTFLKPPAFPTNSDTIARFQILNLPFHVSIALLLMFADWLPGHLKNIQPLIVRSAVRDACIVFVGRVERSTERSTERIAKAIVPAFSASPNVQA